MSSASFMRNIFVKRRLLYRNLRHFSWVLTGSRLTKTYIPKKTTMHQWVHFSCPIVNHPSQSHLLSSKVNNMKKAAQVLSGITLNPGDYFSFWKFIGKPDRHSGYLAGPTFENGKIVESFGGGLCQISGLIFNLALESGMTILERHPHSLDAYGNRRYLPLGRDATVAWVSKDLAFKNDTQFPVSFYLEVDGQRASGVVSSSDPMNFTVEIEQKQWNQSAFLVAQISRKIRIQSGVIKLETFPENIYRPAELNERS